MSIIKSPPPGFSPGAAASNSSREGFLVLEDALSDEEVDHYVDTIDELCSVSMI